MIWASKAKRLVLQNFEKILENDERAKPKDLFSKILKKYWRTMSEQSERKEKIMFKPEAIYFEKENEKKRKQWIYENEEKSNNRS